jgi:hypothetical protein
MTSVLIVLPFSAAVAPVAITAFGLNVVAKCRGELPAPTMEALPMPW